ncbi:MAG: AEC family transporter [Spirochaetaceae bacterium]|nr:MAG: AEC family transporter [Spirochaetaceae bacterium]
MALIAAILPIFAVVALGYLLTPRSTSVRDISGLNWYVFAFALPVLLFDAMGHMELPERIHWTFLVGYFLPTLLLFGSCLIVSMRVFRYNRVQAAVFAMGGSYSNMVAIGLPVVAAALNQAALLPLGMLVAVHSAIMFSITTAFAESGNKPAGGGIPDGNSSVKSAVVLRTVRGMAHNPIVLGLVAGVVFNRSGLTLPPPVLSTITLIRGSALPVALFVTGASLKQYAVVGHGREVALLIVAKLMLHPLLVWLLVWLLRLPAAWAAVAVVTAALPTGINASVFARKYDASVAQVATATLLSTAISLATLTAVLWFLAGPH